MMKKTAAFFVTGCLILTGACSGQKKFSAPDTEQITRHLKAQTAIVPRHSGSDGAKRTADLIQRSAKEAGAAVVRTDVFSEDLLSGKTEFRNIIAEIPGKSREFILIAAHYDTKYFGQDLVFQGANDGASGVAALLEMIRSTAGAGPLPLSLKFVFFDGEECRTAYSGYDGLHGSRHLAEVWKKDGTLKQCRAMILLDMIGDKELQISLADNANPVLAKFVREESKLVKPPIPVSNFGGDILDDHVPFLNAGIPAVDLIDFQFGPDNVFWHTSEDNLSNVSAESIAAAADLAMRLINRIANHRGPFR